jgi:hypothetical protein
VSYLSGILVGMAVRRIGTLRVKVTQKVIRRVTLRTEVTQRPLPRTEPVRVTVPTAPAQVTARPVRLTYSVPERQFLDRVRSVVEADAVEHHAWADRAGAALQLFEALTRLGVDVWFSERDVVLGKSLARQLDGGLRISRVGVVLVTPALLQALRNGGFADQEVSALLGTERVIPVVHEIGYDDLRAESPLLAARAGLSTEGSSLDEVAAKIAESVLGINPAEPDR